MKERIYLNNDWNFAIPFEGGGAQEQVRIPHTCKETPFHYFDESIYQMECGYRRQLYIEEAWRGKRLLLTFEGVAHVALVYVNDALVGEHRCGYTAFTIDITEAVTYGAKNQIAVRLDSRESSNVPPFGFVIDYMTYGGIYRDVYLEVKPEVYLADIFMKSKVLPSKTHAPWKEAAVNIDIEYTIAGTATDLSICHFLDGNELGRQELLASAGQMSYQREAETLWDVEAPNLHTITTQLWRGAILVDEKQTVTGFRQADFRADGFYLNGRKLKIRGLNRHQSYPYVGYAMPKSMQQFDAQILKQELGLNAVRTSHYPQSHYFLAECDRLGLLVFTEIPGWQHIGDAAWKEQAVVNTREMVKQYRNHTSIILWGVRINESPDDDEFYQQTNEVAHLLDETRPTAGVRVHKRSHLLEDVYTYNDFLYDGSTKGCDRKKDVSANPSKAYLVSEYNGHMFPTKSFDCEEHRVEHAIRHATVLDAIAAEADICGSFGWCMFDYNTHQDFGSGDRICYHGVMDMFRNPKLAASIYESQDEDHDVLEVATSMDIGEHPGCNRGNTYVFTNADSVRMYKNDAFIQEFYAADSPFLNLSHGPILIDDFIGNQLEVAEHFTPKQAKMARRVLNAVAKRGLSHLSLTEKLTALGLIIGYRMKPSQAVELYKKYVGEWGGSVTAYRFEAIKNGAVVKTVCKEPMRQMELMVKTDHCELVEAESYDVAAIRIYAVDGHGNILNYWNEPVQLETTGDIELIGPKLIAFQGGMTGTYVKTIGKSGTGQLHLKSGARSQVIDFTIEIKEERK